MTRKTYTGLLFFLAPLVWAWLFYRAVKTQTAWAVLDPCRFGRAAKPRGDRASLKAPVWVHAVSVGETRAAAPLVRALLQRGERVLLTHMTPTGLQTGASLFADALDDGSLEQTWVPYDFPGSCARFIQNHRPRLAVLIEREVWPNLVAQCREQSVPIALVSARLSARGLRRSQRWGTVLQEAYGSLDIVCAQSQDDADRLAAMSAGNISVVGNLKFDVRMDGNQQTQGEVWRAAVGRPVIALASIREEEEEAFARAIVDAKLGDTLVVWVPRHPQRFAATAKVAREHGLVVDRRTDLGQAAPQAQTQVYIGDTLNEMAFYLSASDIVVVGGGFAPLGGQNFIEALVLGRPVIFGPHMFNFADAARDAIAAEVVDQVQTPGQALAAAQSLLARPQALTEHKVRATRWIDAHVGATLRTLAKLP